MYLLYASKEVLILRINFVIVLIPACGDRITCHQKRCMCLSGNEETGNKRSPLSTRPGSCSETLKDRMLW